jgi:copper ion binding protein
MVGGVEQDAQEGDEPNDRQRSSAVSGSALQDVVLTAPDISCGHCTAAIEGAVGALDGVSRVKASIDSKQVEITFDPAKVSLATIESTMDDEGYPVAK